MEVTAPITCPYCGSEVEICKNDKVYGKTYGDWPWIYRCKKDACDTHVGMHPFTNIPLGTLANSPLRRARKESKEVFQRVWMQGGSKTRTEAYSWLAHLLDIPVASCHFGWFDIDTCHRAKKLMEKR